MSAALGASAGESGFDTLRDLYQEVILEHGRRPRHMRRLEPADAVAQGDNPMCGDRVEVRLRFGAGGTVVEAAFEARGCAISVASADLMAEAVAGQGPDAIRALAAGFDAMVRTGTCPECTDRLAALRPLAGVHDYPSRIKCATLPWNALLSALAGEKEATRE
ncbi:MAG: Fe-S cluster assembly sulfur transfer protein SufU [Janthinobacterium lividum]